MDKDTQNVVLVMLSIIVVIVVVIGGGYWYLNYGEGVFDRSGSSNKTIIPKKKTNVAPGEYAVSLEDESIKKLLPEISKHEDASIASVAHVSKVAYARNVVTTTSNVYDIYVYYVFKEEATETNPMINYYSDYEKNSLIISIVESIDDTIFEDYADSVGLYKYTFEFKKSSSEYEFKEVNKVR